MTLKPPNLDDRNFQQLLEEAKRIIKSECPQWTDLSPGDPNAGYVAKHSFKTKP